jgi:transposase
LTFCASDIVGGAHYWARELKAMGHEVLLMPPAYTKPYFKRGKNASHKGIELDNGRFS